VAGIATSRLVLATGINVRLVAAGPGTGTPVVLVHGWGINAYLWRRTMPSLAAAGYRAYAFDLPGHGLSDRPNTPGSYTLDNMTRNLAAVFDALRIERAHVIAQSMGGRIALQYAHDHSARVLSLSLLGSVGFGEVPGVVKLARFVPAPSTRVVRRWMIELGENVVYGRRGRPDKSFIDEYWAPTQFPDFLSAVRQSLVEFDWSPVTADFLARVTMPVLVIFGTRDRTVRPVHAEALVPALPQGRLHWVNDAGHVANEEAYDEVNPLLLEFIRGKA
jgi:pimeloyl-ACP methyl ester carboxylesterase